MPQRFVIRTIKNGRVRINGRYFVPDKRYLEYDGRLDGMRYAFGLYWSNGEMESLVECWGTEVNYHNHDTESWEPDPQLVDGYYPWAIWHEEE
jgi:hypothetical protein